MSSSIAAGRGAVPNTFLSSFGGSYLIYNDGPISTQSHAANSSGNPRIDTVGIKVYDSVDGGDSSDTVGPIVIMGTPTSGATLSNLDGIGTPPENFILLAYVEVHSGDTSSSSFSYWDARPKVIGLLPGQNNTSIIAQPMLPLPGLLISGLNNPSFSNNVIVYATTLEQSITNVTKIRWTYTQNSGSAATGNYAIGIYDSSGRLIASTGSVALTGTASSIQQRAETITSTTFEAGNYYVAWSSPTGSGLIFAPSVIGGYTAGSQAFGPQLQNLFFIGTTGSTTLPSTLNGGGITFKDASYNTGVGVAPLIGISQT